MPGQTWQQLGSKEPALYGLQWRAGQLPGQTPRYRFERGVQQQPSMEGRAIARPNAPTREATDDYPPPSMEGRAIARPNMIPA